MARELDLWRGFPAEARSPGCTREMLRDMRTLSRRLDRMFDDLWGQSLSGPLTTDELLSGDALACDLEESSDHYLLKFDVPGIPKDKLNIEVSGNTLTVSGERETRGPEAGERSYRRLYRSFTLPTDVAADKIEACCENGVLELAIPKSEAAKPKRIQIGEGGGVFTRVAGKAKEALGAGKKEVPKKEGKAA